MPIILVWSSTVYDPHYQQLAVYFGKSETLLAFLAYGFHDVCTLQKKHAIAKIVKTQLRQTLGE